MHYYTYLFIVLVAVSSSFSKIVEIRCPSHCKCDIFENFRRATCSKRKLVVLESNLPKETQLLDLSYNQISKLDDHIFFEQNLLSLELLNISHNKVAQIHMSAFEGLNDLKTLDLSYNAMQYLSVQWFFSLTALEELYLRGNSFGRFSDDPLLESRSLKILDLSKCFISHFGNDVFAKIPNLESLDLSENFLIQLDKAVVKPLTKLTVLKVSKNTFSCNKLMEDLAKYCAKQGIGYRDPCRKNGQRKEKFQKIVNLAEEPEEKNSWIFNDAPENTTQIIEICSNNTETKVHSGLLMEIINLSPTLSILIVFVYGIAVGILIGCSVQIKAKAVDNSQENSYVGCDENGHLRRSNSNRSRGSRRSRNNVEAHESLVLSEWNIYESTPIAQRKN